MILLRLFWEFFKTGLFAVGGGMATVPFLTDIGEKTGWFTSEQLADMIAVADSTPGPIGINMATYVGYTTAGIWGALVSTFALVLPSVIVVLIVARALAAFRDNFYVKSVFYGLRPASAGLIASAGCTVAALAVLNIPSFRQTGELLNLFNFGALALAVVLLVLTNIKKIGKLHPVVFIAASAAVGILLKLGE